VIHNTPHRTRNAPRIALATSIPLTPSDGQLLEPLGALGFIAEPVIWSDPEIAWSRYAAVVIRSCWDYHHRLNEFLAWIGGLETARVPLINGPGLIRWNASKTYLIALGTRGVPIPPTTVVHRNATDEEAGAAIAALPSTTLVIKPAVSATAYETWRASYPLQPADTVRLRALAARGDVIVQTFVEEIASSGELSLVFFGGAYSHAARKMPRQGDFRVQLDHGGLLEIENAPAGVIRQAEAILRHAPSVPTYARVDGVVVGGVFTLMELELIEPELYLSQASAAATRFAAAIAGAITRR
jgi:glutathione synthase/RimK-type ligase-like ATP-grasp enzyme